MKKVYTNFVDFEKVHESKDVTLNEGFLEGLSPKAKALGKILAGADFEEFWENWLDYVSGEFDEEDKKYKSIKSDLEDWAKMIK